MKTLMWFRNDLRTADNPALVRACADKSGVVGVFLVARAQWRQHHWGDTKIDFVLRTLRELGSSLRQLNIPLVVVETATFDDAPSTLLAIARTHGCRRLFFNREYEVNERARDDEVTRVLESAGLDVHASHDQTVLRPGAVRTGAGGVYTVFTPFRRAWLAALRDQGIPSVVRRPRALAETGIQSSSLPESPGDPEPWPAGEREAMRRLKRFAASRIREYAERRDFPDEDMTSRLSPYLAVGAVSARQCLAAAVRANGGALDGEGGAAAWITELAWREFYRHLLVGFPHVCRGRAFKPAANRVRWRDDEAGFRAWCRGETGVPIVDAAMRQLNETGWMHNRLRMIAAMFLTKDLLIDWRRGERYFMNRLVDGDFASNNGGWQWAASTGADAVPYFRIFNPYRQSRRFDPDGSFIRRYVPELRHLEGDAVHEPPPLLRGDYPAPIVDHREAAKAAVFAFKRVPSSRAARGSRACRPRR